MNTYSVLKLLFLTCFPDICVISVAKMILHSSHVTVFYSKQVFSLNVRMFFLIFLTRAKCTQLFQFIPSFMIARSRCSFGWRSVIADTKQTSGPNTKSHLTRFFVWGHLLGVVYVTLCGDNGIKAWIIWEICFMFQKISNLRRSCHLSLPVKCFAHKAFIVLSLPASDKHKIKISWTVSPPEENKSGASDSNFSTKQS